MELDGTWGCEGFHVGTVFFLPNYTCQQYHCAEGSVYLLRDKRPTCTYVFGLHRPFNAPATPKLQPHGHKPVCVQSCLLQHPTWSDDNCGLITDLKGTIPKNWPAVEFILQKQIGGSASPEAPLTAHSCSRG